MAHEGQKQADPPLSRGRLDRLQDNAGDFVGDGGVVESRTNDFVRDRGRSLVCSSSSVFSG